MPDLIVKTATEADIPLLVELRLEFCREMHPSTDTGKEEQIRNALTEYFQTHVRDKSYTGFIGFRADEAVCGGGLLLYQLPPLKEAQARRQGHVLGIFTRPPQRRRGYAKILIKYIIAWAKANGVYKLFLNATAMGEPVYFQLGFQAPQEKAMVLKL
jgi:GNAT superfamily N-acetyltransferase